MIKAQNVKKWIYKIRISVKSTPKIKIRKLQDFLRIQGLWLCKKTMNQWKMKAWIVMRAAWNFPFDLNKRLKLARWQIAIWWNKLTKESLPSMKLSMIMADHNKNNKNKWIYNQVSASQERIFHFSLPNKTKTRNLSSLILIRVLLRNQATSIQLKILQSQKALNYFLEKLFQS